MKTRIDEYPYNVIDYLFDNGLPEDCDCTYVIKNFDRNVEYILNSLSDEKVIKFYDLKFKEHETNPTICTKLNLRIVQIKNIEKRLYYVLTHPSKINILLYGVECLRLTQDINRLKADLEKKKQDLVNQIIDLKVDEDEKKKREFLLYYNNMVLEDLNLTTRILNALHRDGIFNIGELLKRDPKEIRELRNIGGPSFELLIKELQRIGINFWH